MPPLRIFDAYRARLDGQYSNEWLAHQLLEFDHLHNCRSREVAIHHEMDQAPRLEIQTTGDAQGLGEHLEPVLPMGLDLEVVGERGYEPEELVYGSRNEILGVSRGLRYDEPRHRTNHYLRRGGLAWVNGQAVPAEPATYRWMGAPEYITPEEAHHFGDIREIPFSSSPFGPMPTTSKKAKKQAPPAPPEPRMPTRAEVVFDLLD